MCRGFPSDNHRQHSQRRLETLSDELFVSPRGVLENAPAFMAGQPAWRRRRLGESSDAIVASIRTSRPSPDLGIQTVAFHLSKVAVVSAGCRFHRRRGRDCIGEHDLERRYQRLQESILLRTLALHGCNLEILCRYFFSVFASATGIVLALERAGGWRNLSSAGLRTVDPRSFAAARSVFDGRDRVISSRGVGSAPPLEILRAEAE